MEVHKQGVPVKDQAEIKRWIESAEQNGDFDNYAGKRSATRFVEGMLLQLTLDRSKAAATFTGYMHNVSETGFAFWSKKEVPARTTLYVRDANAPGSAVWIQAWVTHCTRGIRGFLIGAAFGGNPRP